MYNNYITQFLRQGGARLPELYNTVNNLDEISVKTVINKEEILNTEKKFPKINDFDLEYSPEVKITEDLVKTCKLNLTTEAGQLLVDEVNNSIKMLKENLKNTVNKIDSHRESQLKTILNILKFNDKIDVKTIHKYINSIDYKLSSAKNKLNDINKDFIKNINNLMDAYNKDKKGYHPYHFENTNLNQVINKIEGNLKETPLISIKEFENINCIYNNTEGQVVGIHLYNGTISVKINSKINNVSFKNLCIEPNKVSSKRLERPTRPIPSPPLPPRDE